MERERSCQEGTGCEEIKTLEEFRELISDCPGQCRPYKLKGKIEFRVPPLPTLQLKDCPTCPICEGKGNGVSNKSYPPIKGLGLPNEAKAYFDAEVLNWQHLTDATSWEVDPSRRLAATHKLV